jgi:hypothetical protein
MICFRSKFVFCPFVFKSLQCASFSQRRYDTVRLIMRLPEMFKIKIILLKQSGGVDSLTVWVCLRTYLYLALCLYSIAIDRYTKLVKLKTRKLLMFFQLYIDVRCLALDIVLQLHVLGLSSKYVCTRIYDKCHRILILFRHIMCNSCNP